MNLYNNIEELIEISEAFEGVKNYLSKSPYRTGVMATGLANAAAMFSTGISTKTAANALSGGTLAEKIIKLKANTAIPGTTSLTNAISKGAQHTINAAKETSNNLFDTNYAIKKASDIAATDTMGISYIPIAVGLTAYGIYRLVKHFKSLKYKEAKLKRLRQMLPKFKDPAKAQKIKKVIQNLQIDVNTQKAVLRQQKQESAKQIQIASQNEDLKKNPNKVKELQKSRQVLSRIN